MPTIPQEQLDEIQYEIADLVDENNTLRKRNADLERENASLIEALYRVRKERDG